MPDCDLLNPEDKISQSIYIYYIDIDIDIIANKHAWIIHTSRDTSSEWFEPAALQIIQITLLSSGETEENRLLHYCLYLNLGLGFC